MRAADFTYVSARTGRCYAAFITDVYAGRIVGCNVSARMDRDMVIAAFKMAVHIWSTCSAPLRIVRV
ncbi:hypothetical protein FACS1894216_14980 [Synergistales bacterium]|nr:hypothetical protein FACS1894216_14980 [Synergistales bacterium]